MIEGLGLVAFHLVLPLLIASRVAGGGGAQQVDWLAEVFVLASYSYLIFFVGQWTQLSYGARYLLPLAFIVAVVLGVRSRRRVKLEEESIPSRDRARRVLGWVLVAFLTFHCVQITVAMNPGDPAVELPAPVRGTTICVTEGGRHPLLNRYLRQNPARTTTEFVSMTPWGRASDTEMTVVSPIDGRVIRPMFGRASEAEADPDADAQADADAEVQADAEADADAQADAQADAPDPTSSGLGNRLEAGGEAATGGAAQTGTDAAGQVLLVQGDSLVVLLHGLNQAIRHGAEIRQGDSLGTSTRLTVDVSREIRAPATSESLKPSPNPDRSPNPDPSMNPDRATDPNSPTPVFVRYESAYLVKNSILSLR